MSKKLIILLFAIQFVGFSQTTEKYKYALVPAKFDFQKSDDEYRINSTLKAFFTQKGFQTFLNNEILSDEFSNQNCNKIYVDLERKSTLFNTSLVVIIKDCKNNILLKSSEGSSKSKEYKAAYNQALLEALKSFGYFDLRKPTSNSNFQSKIQTNEISINPIAETTITLVESKPFTLINKITKEITMLIKTSSPQVFIANSGVKNGVVFKTDKKWIFEYYISEKLVSEELEEK